MTAPIDRIASLLAFSARAELITSLDALDTALAKAVAGLGFRSISTNLISVPGQAWTPGILFGDPEWRAWSRRYARMSLQRSDPAIRMLQTRVTTFTWIEASTTFASPEAEAVMQACRDYTGFEDALVVPVRDVDLALLSVTFAGDRITLDPEMRMALLMTSFSYALRGRELVSGFQLDAKCPLSARQLECLQWVHAGKTDAEIGQILGLSQRTIHNHIEAAKQLLDVAKRSQASLIAWRHGWIL